MPTDPMPGGPSEAAIEAAHSREARRKGPSGCLVAAHDLALGTDRSVNEAWCRADQTRRIVEWLRDPALLPFHLLANGDEFARRVAREFGGGPDAD